MYRFNPPVRNQVNGIVTVDIVLDILKGLPQPFLFRVNVGLELCPELVRAIFPFD